MTNVCKPFQIFLGAGSINSGSETPSGDMIYSGYSLFPNNSYHLMLAKRDSEGANLWQRVIPIGTGSEAYSIAPTSDGGYAVAGDAYFPKKNFDAFFLKTDGLGKPKWGKLFFSLNAPLQDGDDFGRLVRQTPDGGFIVVGASENQQFKNYRAWIIKTNPQGSIEWKRNFKGADIYNSFGWTGGLTKDGGYFVAGGCGAEGVPDMMMLIKTDKSGAVLFNKVVQFDVPTRVYDAKETADGGFLMAGEIEDGKGTASTGIIVKLNGAGELLWYSKSGINEGSFEHEQARFIDEATNGDVITAGLFTGYGTEYSWVRRYTAGGGLLWSNIMDECGLTTGGELLQDGGVALFGSSMCENENAETGWVEKICL